MKTYFLLFLTTILSACSSCDLPIYEAGHEPARCTKCYTGWDLKRHDNNTGGQCAY